MQKDTASQTTNTPSKFWLIRHSKPLRFAREFWLVLVYKTGCQRDITDGRYAIYITKYYKRDVRRETYISVWDELLGDHFGRVSLQIELTRIAASKFLAVSLTPGMTSQKRSVLAVHKTMTLSTPLDCLKSFMSALICSIWKRISSLSNQALRTTKKKA